MAERLGRRTLGLWVKALAFKAMMVYWDLGLEPAFLRKGCLMSCRVGAFAQHENKETVFT